VFFATLALGAVLGVILLLSRLARSIPGLLPARSALGRAPVLCGSLALDSRRRLHLVEIEGRQALVLTGGATDVVVCLSSPNSPP
jgi:hypothetical protein